jgi:hypothetical protein
MGCRVCDCFCWLLYFELIQAQLLHVLYITADLTRRPGISFRTFVGNIRKGQRTSPDRERKED